MPFQKNMLSRFNVSKFMKEKKEIREKQAATHESIAEEKLKLSAAQAKLRRLKGKVSFLACLQILCFTNLTAISTCTVQILQTDLHTFPQRISREKLI